jgi:hypothetical protein
MSMARSFKFTKIKAGWVDAEVRTSSDTQTVDASYLTDAIRDFADALASLATARAATCKWEQEPGELEWAFNRSGDHLTVVVALLYHSDRKPCFDCSFRYRSFCGDVLDSLNDLKNTMGLRGYEEEWGYPFPVEAHRKLEKAMLSNGANEAV